MRHYNLSGHQVFKDKLLGKSMGFPDGLDSKESVRNMGDISSIPGLGRSPGERNGNPLQYSCLENSMDRGAWQATVHRVAALDTMERLPLSLSYYSEDISIIITSF